MNSKVILITGGSSGIGKAVGIYLQKKGHTIFGTSRNPQRLKNHPFKLVKLDVNSIESISEAVQQVVRDAGKIDVLVNNAGMGITGPIEDTPTDEMRRVFDTNFFGAIDVAKTVLPHMRAQGSGCIINITSIAGYMGLPYRGIYSASKGALELVTEALRMEVRPMGIQVVNVAPGDFATAIANGRYHTPVFKNSPYKNNYELNLKLMDEHVDSGGDPIAMAKAVHKIINTKRPKVSYKVGAFMQKFSIVLKGILPSKVYEKLLMNHYKIS